MRSSAASYLVEGGGALVLPPRFLRAPSLRDGLRVVPVAGGLCLLAWWEEVGSDPLRIRLRGLRPPTTFVLTAAGLWQQSVLQRGGAVNRCWCDGGGGYPPSSGGGLRRINAFRRLPRPLWWVPVGGPSECYPVVSYCVRRPVGGASTFSPLERATLHWNIRGLRPAFARQKEVPRRLVVHKRALRSVVVEYSVFVCAARGLRASPAL
jgi:hypothetical protein